MLGELYLHATHIAGMRMILEGADGLYPGSLHKGVMSGTSMLAFIPLHLGAVECSPELMNWVKEWFWDCPTFLSPEGWFRDSQRTRTWSPPPAAAETVIEMLGKAKHKWPELTHLVLIPRLMTSH